MKLKLSVSEFITFYHWLKWMVFDLQVSSWENKLAQANIISLHHKFHIKSDTCKNRYCITMTPAEAIAFYLLTRDLQLSNSSYTGNLFNKVNSTIHQKYS